MPILTQFAFYNWFNFTDIFNGGELPRNNQASLWNMRDRLFFNLFERMAAAYANAIPPDIRRLIENCFLALALLPLFTLIYIHINFIQTPVNCLSEVSRIWPRDGILRVELGFKDPRIYSYGICHHESVAFLQNMPDVLGAKTPIEPIEGNDTSFQSKPALISANDAKFPKAKLLNSFSTTEFPDETIQANFDYFNKIKSPVAYVESYSDLEWAQQDYVIEYTLEYGFLKLSPEARQKLQIPTLVMVINPEDKECFGNRFSQFLLKYIVGYSDVIMSSLRNLVDKDKNKGFVRNIVTGDQYRFVNKTLTWTSYGIAAITMIAFTLSISMLLRYSHHQIFMFIVQLLNVLEFNLNVTFPAASLLTVVFALVAAAIFWIYIQSMEAIMSEFFNDGTTAFYIILIVWIGDQYDSICSHSIVTKRHWLRFFFLYHFGFYAYDHRFNGQYSSLALLTSWMFIMHSMIYFFHHFELPPVPHRAHNANPHYFHWTFNFDRNHSEEFEDTSDILAAANSESPASLPQVNGNL